MKKIVIISMMIAVALLSSCTTVKTGITNVYKEKTNKDITDCKIVLDATGDTFSVLHIWWNNVRETSEVSLGISVEANYTKLTMLEHLSFTIDGKRVDWTPEDGIQRSEKRSGFAGDTNYRVVNYYSGINHYSVKEQNIEVINLVKTLINTNNTEVKVYNTENIKVAYKITGKDKSLLSQWIEQINYKDQ